MSTGVTVLVRARVSDFEGFKAVFDGHEEARVRHGGIGHRLLRDTRDPLAFTVLVEFTSMGGATGFTDDVSLLEALRAAGVEGGPHGGGFDIDYLEEVEIVAQYRQ
jgi:hypothetical protein